MVLLIQFIPAKQAGTAYMFYRKILSHFAKRLAVLSKIFAKWESLEIASTQSENSRVLMQITGKNTIIRASPLVGTFSTSGNV